MKYINKIFVTLLLIMSTISFSQVTVSPFGCSVTPGGSVTDCGTIDLGSNNSVNVQFGINLSKPYSQVVGLSDLYIYYQKSSSDSRQQLSWVTIMESTWTHTNSNYPDTNISTGNVTLNASNFNVSGGTLFVVFKTNSGVEYTSCPYSIIKNQTPTFAISPTSTSIACGDTSARTFTVTPANIPTGSTVTYQWSYSGWNVVSSTTNSKTLQPSSGTTLPSSVSVTPYINGVAQPSISCSVSRSGLGTSAIIAGATNICSGTSFYTITGVLAGQTVSWSLSNPSIATLSNQSNTGTNITFNGNGAQTLTATITNICGQTVTKPFQINSGATTFTSSATITGASTTCSSSSTYSISGILAGQTVNWSSSNTSIATISNPTSSSVTINIGSSGSFNLIATILNSCGQSAIITYPITTYLVASLPIPSGYFDVDLVDCYHDGALTINYYPDVPFGGVITLTPSLLPHPLQSQTKNITVKYTNPCTGAYTSKVITYKYVAPNCSGAKMSNNTSIYQIYPNPSKDIVNIDLKDQNNQLEKGTIISGELFDMMGQSKAKVEIKDNKATFSVRGLNKGVYVLKIYINDQVESHQIVVE